MDNHFKLSVFIVTGRGGQDTIESEANVGESTSFSLPKECHEYSLKDPRGVPMFQKNKFGDSLEENWTDRAKFEDSGPIIKFTIKSVRAEDEGVYKYEYKNVSAPPEKNTECKRIFQLKVHRPGKKHYTLLQQCF